MGTLSLAVLHPGLGGGERDASVKNSLLQRKKSEQVAETVGAGTGPGHKGVPFRLRFRAT